MPKKRTGTITKEEALNRFHEYYNERHKNSKPIVRLRAKMFDMMYQKKPKFVLKPGEPGSEKYMLEEGPRTFDMEGVDHFPEGDSISIKSDDYDVNVTSKGSTYYDSQTDDTSENELETDNSGNKTSKTIYGPRLKSGRLYSKHFREKYNARKDLDSTEKGSLKDKNLVDQYWDMYKNDSVKHKRKNKNTIVPKDDTVRFLYNNSEYHIHKNLDLYKNEKIIGNVLDDIHEEIFMYLQQEGYIYTDGINGDTHLVRGIWESYMHPLDETITYKVYFDSDDIKIYDFDGNKLVEDDLLETFLENIDIDFDEFLQYKIEKDEHGKPITPERKTPESPVSDDEPPVSDAESPVSDAESPVSAAESPVTAAESPVSAAESPVSAAESPVSDAESPVSDMESPKSPSRSTISPKDVTLSVSSQPETDENILRQHCYDCLNNDPNCENSDCKQCDYCPEDKEEDKEVDDKDSLSIDKDALCSDCKARNVDCTDSKCKICDYCKELKYRVDTPQSPEGSVQSTPGSIDLDALKALNDGNFDFLEEESEEEEDEEDEDTEEDIESPVASETEEVTYEGDAEYNNPEKIVLSDAEKAEIKNALSGESLEGLSAEEILDGL